MFSRGSSIRDGSLAFLNFMAGAAVLVTEYDE